MAAIPPPYKELMKPVSDVLGSDVLNHRLQVRSEIKRDGLHVVMENTSDDKETVGMIGAKGSVLYEGLNMTINPVLQQKNNGKIALETSAKLTGIYPGLELGGAVSEQPSLSASYGARSFKLIHSTQLKESPIFHFNGTTSLTSSIRIGASAVLDSTSAPKVASAVTYNSNYFFMGATVDEKNAVIEGLIRPSKKVTFALRTAMPRWNTEAPESPSIVAGASFDVSNDTELSLRTDTKSGRSAASIRHRWTPSLSSAVQASASSMDSCKVAVKINFTD